MVKFIVIWCIAVCCAGETTHQEVYVPFVDYYDAECFYESVMDLPCARLDTVPLWDFADEY